MKSALLSLEGALLEHARRLQECEECVLCLFGNCGNRTRECVPSELPLGSLPSCEAVLQAQAIPEQPAQNWALSKACAPYRRLCSGQEMSPDSCIRLMVSHCQLRLQECRLESDMDYLNTVADQSDPGLCGHRGVPAPNATMAKAKIVGGSKAWPGAWPWLVSVRLNGELMCGGVLVGDAWVLTAAHCFTGSRNELAWSVVLGDYDLTKPDEGERVVPVSRILSHPKFNPKTFHNDVALLELSNPVTPSAWVTPVCLPEQPMELATGMPCYIIGWGSLYEDGPGADVVMEAQVPILAQDICRGALGRQLFTSAMFCAGFLSGGVDSCQGDSGGPLTCWDPLSERYVLYGITSWGDGCGERGKPGVYTRVAAFTDWVHQQMEKSPSSREPTCFELLALAQMPPDRQRMELGHLCAFYTQPCSPSASPAACAHAADEKCKAKRQQCELRSYAQTLLEFLRRAEEFFRTQIDFSFFTHSLPQFMEQVYHHLFPPRARQDSRGCRARGGRCHRRWAREPAAGCQENAKTRSSDFAQEASSVHPPLLCLLVPGHGAQFGRLGAGAECPGRGLENHSRRGGAAVPAAGRWGGEGAAGTRVDLPSAAAKRTGPSGCFPRSWDRGGRHHCSHHHSPRSCLECSCCRLQLPGRQ
ncbi:serine protease 56 [Podarcis lilfordi]|nr:serine protease 56 [Podarcis lilfordi]